MKGYLQGKDTYECPLMRGTTVIDVTGLLTHHLHTKYSRIFEAPANYVYENVYMGIQEYGV